MVSDLFPTYSLEEEPSLLESAFAEAEAVTHIEFRDPFGEKYSQPERMTRTQRLAHAFFENRREGLLVPHPRKRGHFIRRPPIIVMIGAKGSGKTRFGAKFAMDQAQRYVGSMGCIISNTYTQATDNAAPQLIEEAGELGIAIEFFKEKKIRGKLYKSLFVIDLDGQGIDNGMNSYVLVRSFEAVSKLEGIELDYLWCEEVQDTDWDSFNVAYTRVRGKNANRAIYVAAMPFDETHWMYSRFPTLGAVEENKIRASLGIDPFDGRAIAEAGLPIPETVVALWEGETVGVMFEPSIFENEKNLPDGEIDRLSVSLDAETFERWIYGNRTSMTTDKIAYAYNDELHRKGRASRILSRYDPAATLVLSVDFNTRPMCASVWHIKPWSDTWLTHEIAEIDEETGLVLFREEVDGDPIEHAGIPDRDVGVQIDEFELWKGDTAGLMEAFLLKYGNHNGEIYILGDATGDRDDTRSGTTDWEIITNAVAHMPNAIVIKGLIVTSNPKTGKTNFLNPKRRDTFNVLNAALKDGRGRSWIFFAPSSTLKSGGVAASLIAAKKLPNGVMDDTNDKKPDETLPRTHFFDTVRYFTWWLRGGLVGREEFDDNVRALQTETKLLMSDDDEGSWVGLFG